ncbi:tRNA 5-methoxyuridine(34)/uridine 5-oxyacetic acid(34) synthase CmoB [Paraphotobacterium marinum]|uniref:tRNA U34 carboxymethyltransferase n=1 Tax=Paraphotobacterium marinum TaxID=1755811 RepID=A0A220VDY2_9GAMM|nr:tRNA 5-methoxyuridine(34)/uridine 5-oxyacetic acid(34) synthase CmoB [Paraphotobacterium marinum]ASK78575.1 tRNA 5-methoxyuridine(34)/uridine 5-oxyacetic acid(34) synthase CmoB [Paraphotobacterium marinum]
MQYFKSFYNYILNEKELSVWIKDIPSLLIHWEETKNSDFESWKKIIKKIPIIQSPLTELKNQVALTNLSECINKEDILKLESLLKKLSPWRKGPFTFGPIKINTEWRSDWKWKRIIRHIAPLKNRKVLDVGCGNGYYMWRMLGEEARSIIGVDPSQLFFSQFNASKKLLGINNDIYFIPLPFEKIPPANCFDTVFSMGVLYHRVSPIEHLSQLRDQLRPGGELVLETMVVPGDETTVLVPKGRYAQMRNVYFFPSSKALVVWLEKCKFTNIKIVNESDTTIEEQRQTDWMKYNSLDSFLNSNQNLTVEGYPPPRRVIITANRP